MESVDIWKEQQKADIEELKDSVKKWKAETAKDAKSWRDEISRQINYLKETMIEEVESIKKEVKDGYKGFAGKSSSSADLLGPATGESDQTEADDNTRRKRRSSPAGPN